MKKVDPAKASGHKTLRERLNPSSIIKSIVDNITSTIPAFGGNGSASVKKTKVANKSAVKAVSGKAAPTRAKVTTAKTKASSTKPKGSVAKVTSSAKPKSVSAKASGALSKKTGTGIEGSKFFKLFLDELKDIYWAEKNLVKALPKIQKGATSTSLKNLIGAHLEETKIHVTRIEEVFFLLDRKPMAVKCEAMEGLIKEGDELLKDLEKDTMVRDAGLIIGSQKIEHYEIAAYGSLSTFAKKLGNTKIVKLLEATLAEEKRADFKLTNIAMKSVNAQASKE